MKPVFVRKFVAKKLQFIFEVVESLIGKNS